MRPRLYFQAIEGSEGFAGVDWICGTFDRVVRVLMTRIMWWHCHEMSPKVNTSFATCQTNVVKPLMRTRVKCLDEMTFKFWSSGIKIIFWWCGEVPVRLYTLFGIVARLGLNKNKTLSETFSCDIWHGGVYDVIFFTFGELSSRNCPTNLLQFSGTQTVNN